MFIPTWLLVVIAVVVLSVFLPAIWEALKGMALLVSILLVIVSIPASLYFFYRTETQTAWIVSVPWIAAAVWGLLLGGVESIKTSAWLHDIRSRAATLGAPLGK